MNYPNGTKKAYNNDKIIPTNYKNRGMSLEKMLNDTNKYYIERAKSVEMLVKTKDILAVHIGLNK